LITLAFVAWPVAGRAQTQWVELSSPQYGFAALFPIAPKESEVSANQHNFLADLGDRAYIISVLDNVASSQDWTKLVEAYARGSNSKVRSQNPATVVGHAGVEAITDGDSDNLTSLVDLALVGNRLYQIVSVGPKGHETSADAFRFRDSFRLVAQQWAEFSSPQYGFAAMFPKPPTESQASANQRNFLADLGNTAYLVSIVDKAAAKQDWKKLVELYAKGSNSKVRTQRPVTLVGQSGVEAITDDETSNLTSLVDMVVVSNRLYQVVSIGPTGHDTSADAYRFRDSFRTLQGGKR
jgi:hypothetical protein